MSFPFGPQARRSVSDIALEFGAVARITWGAAHFLQFPVLRSSLCCLCIGSLRVSSPSAAFSDPATDGSYLISKLICELNSEMAQAADPLHRNKIAGKRPAMPQRVVCSDAGAEQRRCFDGAQSIRLSRAKRLDGRHHVLLISTVVANTWNFHVPAIAKNLRVGTIDRCRPGRRANRHRYACPCFPLGNTGA